MTSDGGFGSSIKQFVQYYLMIFFQSGACMKLWKIIKYGTNLGENEDFCRTKSIWEMFWTQVWTWFVFIFPQICSIIDDFSKHFWLISRYESLHFLPNLYHIWWFFKVSYMYHFEKNISNNAQIAFMEFPKPKFRPPNPSLNLSKIFYLNGIDGGVNNVLNGANRCWYRTHSLSKHVSGTIILFRFLRATINWGHF